jgi:RNA polymerase sigma-70 factor (ECF subfamily)
MLSTEFINDCMSGDEGAIQQLVRTYQRGVFQVALSMLDRSQASQEEIVAQAEMATRETFIVVLDRLNRYRIEHAFEPWLYGITIQVSRRRAGRWRSERFLRGLLGRAADIFTRRGAADPVPAAPTGGSSESAQARARSDEVLWNAVCGLKDTLRLPVILRYYHDFSVEQIASMLNVGVGAVHARLDQAREKIAALRAAHPE